MKLLKGFKKRKILQIAISFLSVMLIAPLVLAINADDAFAPQVYISDFNINKTEAKPGEIVKGSFTAKNGESYILNDVTLIVGLSKVVKDIKPSSEATAETDIKNPAPLTINTSLGISSSIVSQSLTLKPGASFKKEFAFELPKNLSDGKHFITVSVISGRGENFGNSEEKQLNISGGNSFIAQTDEKIVGSDGHEYSPAEGIVFEKNSAPKVKFKLKNYGGKATATPQITIYKRSVDDRNFIKKTTGEKIDLGANEEKNMEMTLPSLEKPMIYLAEVKLLDSSETPLSNMISYRWAIKGFSPQILTLNADKINYSKGEVAEIKYTIAGSGDLEKRNENGDLTIEITDKNGKVVGEENKTISLDGDGGKVDIKLNRSANGYTLRAKILKGKETLDSYEVKVAGETEKSALPIYLTGILLGIILIGGGIYMIKKNKSKLATTIALFLLVTATSFIFSGKAFAAQIKYMQSPLYSADPSQFELDYAWSEPKNTEINPGDTLQISGTIKARSCGNLFVNEAYSLFLVIPESTLSGGAYINTEKLDTTASIDAWNKRIYGNSYPPTKSQLRYNLGAIDGIDYNYGGVAGLHRYHKDWVIPSNLPAEWRNRDDTYIMIAYRGDHSWGDRDGDGVWNEYPDDIEARYRLIATQKLKILNSRPVPYHVSPVDNPAPLDSTVTSQVLTGKAADVDGDTTSVAITYRSKLTTDTDTNYTSWSYADMDSSNPGIDNFSILGTQNTNRSSVPITVSAGRTYQWRVRGRDVHNAYSDINTDGWTTARTFTVGGTPPAQPTLGCMLSAVPTSGTLPLTVAFTATPIETGGTFTNKQYRFLTDSIQFRSYLTSYTASYTFTTSGNHTGTAYIKSDTWPETPCTPNPLSFTVDPWSGGDQNEVAP